MDGRACWRQRGLHCKSRGDEAMWGVGTPSRAFLGQEWEPGKTGAMEEDEGQIVHGRKEQRAWRTRGSWETAELLALIQEREGRGSPSCPFAGRAALLVALRSQDLDSGQRAHHFGSGKERRGTEDNTSQLGANCGEPWTRSIYLICQQLVSPTIALWGQHDDNANSPEHPTVPGVCSRIC